MSQAQGDHAALSHIRITRNEHYYDEYGNSKVKGNTSFINETTFTGAVADKSNGLYYMNARFYNPESGRFLSKDSYPGSAADPVTQNLYTYGNNNPTNIYFKEKFEAANFGVLFIEEIDQIPEKMQLGIIEILMKYHQSKFYDNTLIPLNVRVIIASRGQLEKEIEMKILNSESNNGLDAVKIKIPPLRERIDDIPLIAVYIFKKCNKNLVLNLKEIDPVIFQMFSNYLWPGNVRELEHVIERAMNLAWILRELTLDIT
ncbi:MAG: sigma 54-interacting transcriptional regulator [Eubacteriaceae bacterium]|nr:sigma 54-interacting transcriptional regulator [Eubacteriaceae bacterium]